MVVHQDLTTFIVALFLEALLFGAFTITYTMGAWSLSTTLTSRRHSMQDWILLSGSTAMFGLALAVCPLHIHNASENLMLTLQHLTLSLNVTLVSFVVNAGSLYSVDNTLSGTSAWNSTLGAPRFGIYVTQTLIGDTFMVNMIFNAYITHMLTRNPTDIQTFSCVESQSESDHTSRNIMHY